jgi:hypothetical protein
VIGLVGRTQHLWDLLADYQQNTNAGQNRSAAPDRATLEEQLLRSKQKLTLVDLRHGQLAAHPWMTQDHVKALTEDEITRLRLPRDVLRAIEHKLDDATAEGSDRVARLSDYRDPIGQPGFAPKEFGGRWLAAAHRVTGTEWLVLVQEQYEDAIAPAERMRSDLLIYAIAALAVGGGLILMFWYFVTQALTERTSVASREHNRSS